MSTGHTVSTSKTKKGFRRWAWPVAGVLVVAWLCFLGYINWAMQQPPEVFGHVMAHVPMPAYFVIPFETLWSRARKGQLNPGDTAPNLAVKKLEDKSPVDLNSLWAEKPVVLVFGSYT